MGNSASSNSTAATCKINSNRMQQCLRDENTFIIHTMSPDREHCLIQGTLTAHEEVHELNRALETLGASRPVVIYGKNACDGTIVTKYNQLVQLGFSNVLVYPGGMFEWLLLQDVYGSDKFPTKGQCVEILDYETI